MIVFQTKRNTDGKIVQFTVDGHSGFSEEGKDIVCASVSSTVWMTLNGIEKQKLAELKYEERDGYVNCHISEDRSASADAMLESLISFMDELSKQYGKYICVSQV